MNWNRKLLLHNLFLILLLCIPTIVVVSCKDSNFQSATIQKYVEQEKELNWDIRYQLSTTLVESGETMFVNYTVLPSSASSVNFTFYHDNRILWTPTPSNFTLAPGESYTEIFHLNYSYIDGVNYFRYNACVFSENKTATVRWGYEVIKTNFLPTIDIIATFTITAVISVISILIVKRKR